MAKDRIVIAELDIDVKSLVKAAADSKGAISALKAELDKTKQAGTGLSAENAKLEAELQRVTAAYTAQKNALAINTSANQALLAQQQSLNAAQQNSAGAAQQVTTAMQGQSKTFTDYKQQVTDSFNQINILNGGLGGLISRAQEVGGAGPLVTGALSGMAAGITGMTQSALAFIATPVGAILAALVGVFALIKNAMDNSTESADKVSRIFTTFSVITDKLMRVLEPLGGFLIDGIANGFELAGKAAEGAMGFIADGLSLLGFDEAAEDVRNFTEDIKATAAEANNLKEAHGRLNAEMALQAVANEKAKQQMDDLVKKSKDETLSHKERIKALQEAGVIEKKNLDERKAQSNEAYNLAERDLKQKRRLTAEEIENLKTADSAYTAKLMKVIGVTAEELDTLKKAQVAKMQFNTEEKNMLTRQQTDLQNITKKFDDQNTAYNDKLEAEREARNNARLSKKAARLEEAARHERLLLDQTMALHDSKERSLEEEMALAKKVYDHKVSIANAEFNITKKNANDELQLDIALENAKTEYKETRMTTAIAIADRELEKRLEIHKAILGSEELLNEELYQAKLAALTNDRNAEEISYKLRKTNGINNEEVYQAELLRIAGEYNLKKETLDAQKSEADKLKAAVDLQSKRQTDQANHDYDLQYQLKAYSDQRAEERIIAEKSGADMKLFDEATAKGKQEIEQKVMDNKLSLASSTFGNLAAIMGKESAAGKAMAVAQATIDTYKSAVSAYSSLAGIPIVGPALGAVAAGAAVAAGIANVKKITATKEPKAPKAERGALFNIGGNRHSAGGTMFTGADGTRFEAEQGELIGVMNRNAARHFMAFNNAFPAGGSTASNYFAGGGIVSREIAPQGLNTDELAAKIAMANSSLPAPVVAVQDIVTQRNSYVKVRDMANF